MTIFSLYIFDRHCTCVYYHDWNRTVLPKPANKDGILPAVSRAVSPQPPATYAATDGGATTSNFSSPRNTLSSSSGIGAAFKPDHQRRTSWPPPAPAAAPSTSTSALPFDEEAKLVYGVVLSLRSMVKKLSKREEEQFGSYRTSTYKLHLYETPSGYKFVMLTDPRSDSVRFILRQLYSGPFIDYVVRNPLVDMDSREHGIDNEFFRTSTDRLIRGLSIFQ